jgi:hypothetical protein
MTRVIIEVRGGSVVAIGSNAPVEYIVVDWDNGQNGTETVQGPYEPDYTGETLHEMFQGEEVAERLKGIGW